jgi:alpha-beta hydrolase superfamily lysophospholipase
MLIDIAIKYITNREGLRFFTQRWIPSDPKGLIVLVHGFGDHSGRYAHVVNHFAGLGYAVATYDHRGHGRSDGRRGDIDGFAPLVGDLNSFVWETRHSVPEGTPVFIVAMSVGALVTLNYSVTHPNDVDGIVLVSSAIGLQIDLPGWMRWGGQKLVRLLPKLPVTVEFEASDLTRDQDAIEVYRSDPLVFQKFTLRTCQTLMQATAMIMSLAFRIRHPVLMLHVKGDPICSFEAAEKFFAQIPDRGKKLVAFDGNFHEPFNDYVRTEAYREIEAWLDGITAQSGGHARTAQGELL